MKPIQTRLLLALAAFALWLGPAPSKAYTPVWNGLLNYQGQLTDTAGNALPDGTYSITFRIYDHTSTQVWAETQPTVSTSKGLFNVVLGSVSPLTAIAAAILTDDLYLGITVAPDAEMSPRQQLLPSVYSLNSQLLNGQPVGSAPFNIVALDGTGRIPAGLLASGSANPPLDLTGNGGAYNLNVQNTSILATSKGLVVRGYSAISATASNSAGYGVWGMSNPADAAASIGMRASATNGYGLVAESANGFALSATAGAGNSNPAIIAQGKNAIWAVSNANGVALQASTPAGNLSANLVDKVNNAAVYASTNLVSSTGVSATATLASAIIGRSSSALPTDYGVWGDNLGGGAGVGGTGYIGVSGTGSHAGTYGYSPNFYGVQGETGNGGVGVYALGTYGVWGRAGFPGGRGVYADGQGFGDGLYASTNGPSYYGVNASNFSGTAVLGASSALGYYGVEGTNSAAAGIAIHGMNSGAGYGVKGEATGVGGTGVWGNGGTIGVWGNGSGTGVKGDATASNAIGVWGNSASGPGVYGSGGPVGVSGSGSTAGVIGTGGPYGVSGTGSTAGVWGYSGNWGVAGFTFSGEGVYGYGVAANNGWGGQFIGSYGVIAQGTTGGVNASASSGNGMIASGTNADYFANGNGLYGFYLSNPSAPVNGIGVYSQESCATCYSGNFINTAATTTGPGAALNVYGRIRVQAGTSAGLQTWGAGVTVGALSNPYILSTSLIILTPRSACTSTYAVTSVVNGTANVTFTPALATSTTFSYLIIGQ